MPSPFKFLDAYTRSDADQFFGREEETDQLFELVNENRLVLLYGPSGTGKTSLIQCGLGNRFEPTDWMPIFIRRGRHLPTSLQKALVDQWDEELDGNFWQIDENPLPRIIEDLYEEYLRPIYLVFDQLEEIFILGDEEEQRIFTQAMADIYDAKLPCRLLFVLREEYLAHLYDFEQRIPTLFKRRLRVEAMSGQQAEEVVRQSCSRFHITLENSEQSPANIITKISSGRSGVALPYLQVYLDRLYREDFARTYPKATALSSDDLDTKTYPLTFTEAEIEAFGELGDVLKAFLQEQTQEIQSEMAARFPDLSDRAVRKVLSSFATLQGTKIPQVRSELQIPAVSDSQLDAILQRLQQARILREEEGSYELAHDTLASEIANQRSGAEQALLEISELVHNRYRAYSRTQTSFLDSKELQLVESYEAQLREEQHLGAEEWDFIVESSRVARQRKNRSRWITTAVIAGLSVMLVFAFGQWQAARIAKDNAEIAQETAEDNEQLAKEAKLDAEQALERVEEEKKKANEQRKIAQKALIDVYEEKIKNATIEYSRLQKLLTQARDNEYSAKMIRDRRNDVYQQGQLRSRLESQLDSLNTLVRE